MNAIFDITDLIIETKRLILRPWKESDINDLFEYASVPGVGEMAGWPHHENIEVSKNIVKRFIDGKKTFAIVYKENNKVIGSLGVEEYGRVEALTEFYNYRGRSIGYVLSKDYWGQGLMPEAVKAVINYLFDVLDYDFLLCSYFNFNNRSKRVQEKCGFIPYRALISDTAMGTQEPSTLNLLKNPHKDIEFEFSHPETLLIKD